LSEVEQAAARSGNTMIETILEGGAISAMTTISTLWQQLMQLWELIVMVCRFLWDLLRMLGGA
jgi:fluoride ion exporter CrcB/FEX